MRRLPVLALLALALAGSASGRPAAAPPMTVTTLVVKGHGWGHAVGMAQWGAYGYAENGSTYGQILAHYYPETQLAQAPDTTLRVLLATGKKRVSVSSTADFSVRDAAGAVHHLAAGSYTLGPRLRVRGLGVLPGPLLFEPCAAPLALETPYRGSIEVSSTTGRLTAVNEVGVDAYLRGVVSQEMPKDWPLAALEAQAVAARSYALSGRRTGSFDVYADSTDQVYGGIPAESPATNAAVDATKGQVLLYGHSVARTYFSSSSGGRTAAVADAFPQQKPVPYLVSVSDPYDTMSPWHDWGPLVLDAAQVSRELKVPGVRDLLPSPVVGHARTVAVTGSSGTVTLPAASVRWALDLRSTWFEVAVLSLSRPAKTRLPGATVTLTGVARRVAAVALEERSTLGVWQAGPPIEPEADGTFSVDVTPTGTTEYRLVADGVQSRPLSVPVAGS